jgi:hypothetical protein
MHLLSNEQERFVIASITGIAICTGLVLASGLNLANASRPPAAAQPLQLISVNIPSKTLVSATPSNVSYTVTSSNGPFCLEAFLVNPGLSSPIKPQQIGGVLIHLNRIDGNGVSHPSFTLVDGGSGGVSPLDIVLSYGNHICANGSLEFQATEFASGGGVDITLFGRAIVLAPPGSTIIVQ